MTQPVVQQHGDIAFDRVLRLLSLPRRDRSEYDFVQSVLESSVDDGMTENPCPNGGSSTRFKGAESLSGFAHRSIQSLLPTSC
jgi:hypothetical protein